jgi:hypothetical protein
MIDITKFAGLVSRDHGLAVIALALPDGTAHVSVVSAGVLSHPVTGIPAVGVVAGGGSRKLGRLTPPGDDLIIRSRSGSSSSSSGTSPTPIWVSS